MGIVWERKRTKTAFFVLTVGWKIIRKKERMGKKERLRYVSQIVSLLYNVEIHTSRAFEYVFHFYPHEPTTDRIDHWNGWRNKITKQITVSHASTELDSGDSPCRCAYGWVHNGGYIHRPKHTDPSQTGPRSRLFLLLTGRTTARGVGYRCIRTRPASLLVYAYIT